MSRNHRSLTRFSTAEALAKILDNDKELNNDNY